MNASTGMLLDLILRPMILSDLSSDFSQSLGHTVVPE